MSVIANWYLTKANGQTLLHWWTSGTKGTSSGRDYEGRQGSFAETVTPLASWQEYDNILTFTGLDGKRALATLSTHYKNAKYPAQCISGKEELLGQLEGVRKV